MAKKNRERLDVQFQLDAGEIAQVERIVGTSDATDIASVAKHLLLNMSSPTDPEQVREKVALLQEIATRGIPTQSAADELLFTVAQLRLVTVATLFKAWGIYYRLEIEALAGMLDDAPTRATYMDVDSIADNLIGHLRSELSQTLAEASARKS